MKLLKATIILAIVLLAFNAQAANILVDEDFDDQSVDRPLMVKHAADGDVTDQVGTAYSFVTDRHGTGYAIYQSSWDWRHLTTPWYGPGPGQWPTDELYFSVWMKYVSISSDNGYNIGGKFFYPHFGGGSQYVHMGFTSHSGYFASTISSTGGTSGYYGFDGAPVDGKWHRYEWYIRFSDGRVRFRFDGQGSLATGEGLSYNRTVGRISSNVYYISFPGICDKGCYDTGTQYTRQWDDIEVWDGIPGEPFNYPPNITLTTPSGCPYTTYTP
jgi:hypothetical protein